MTFAGLTNHGLSTEEAEVPSGRSDDVSSSTTRPEDEGMDFTLTKYKFASTVTRGNSFFKLFSSPP